MYSVEEKDETIEMFATYSVKEISEMTGISLSTLYKWKKQYEEEKQISKLIRSYINTKEYNKALEMAINFPNNKIIQSQIITIYIQKKEYEKAIEIGEKFPNYAPIQSQMITIYTEMKKYEKVIQIGENFKYDELIQSQMISIYIQKKEYEKAFEIGEKFPNYASIQSQIIKIYIEMEKYDKAIEISEKFKDNEPIQNQITSIKKMNETSFINEKKLNYNELNIIRSKILLNTITLKDINLLDNIKDEIEETIYLLVKAAIYERLNLKKKCIEILKMINHYDDKKIKQLIQKIENNKVKYYNIEKWDSIIGWSIEQVDTYLEEKQKAVVANRIVQIKKTIDQATFPTKDSKKEPKNAKIIFGSFSKKESKKINNKSIEIKQEKKEPTIYELLNNQYKQMIYYLKLQYYREMYNPETRKDATFKYDRLEEILNQKVSNKNAFRQLLLMLVGAGYKEVIKNDYQEEYQIISNQISRKKQEIKLLTKKG